MLICDGTTTGRVLYMEGPFYANQNDANIIKNLIEDPNGLRQLLNEDDKLFLDRGFLRCERRIGVKRLYCADASVKGQAKSADNFRSKPVSFRDKNSLVSEICPWNN